MRAVSIVSKRIIRIMGVSLAYHDKKTEFLNSFVSLILQRINRIMVKRVCQCLFKPCYIKKENNKRHPMEKAKGNDAG